MGLERVASWPAAAARLVARRLVAVATCTVGGYVLLAIVPALLAGSHPRIAAAIRRGYGACCAQVPSHTLLVRGAPMAICARCFALYGSLAAVGGAWWGVRRLFPAARVRLATLALACLPMAVDVLTQSLGLRESTQPLRLLTGALAGGTAAFLVFPILGDASASAQPTT